MKYLLGFLAFKAECWKLFGSIELSGIDKRYPVTLLRQIPWSSPERVSLFEKEVAKSNFYLDTQSYFADLLKVAVLIGKYFPASNVFFIEILENYNAKQLIKEASKNKFQNPEDLEDVLKYEAMYGVITLNGVQFDPYFAKAEYPLMKKHPKTASHNLWMALYAIYVLSYSVSNYLNDGESLKNHASRLEGQVDLICRNLLLSKKAKALIAHTYFQSEKAYRLFKEINDKSQSAKNLFYLWNITGDTQYRDTMEKVYGPWMLQYIKGGLYQEFQSSKGHTV